jgi:transposase
MVILLAVPATAAHAEDGLGTIRVVQQDRAGDPITGGCYRASSDDDNRERCVIDDGATDGVVTLERLIPGTFTVHDYRPPAGYGEWAYDGLGRIRYSYTWQRCDHNGANCVCCDLKVENPGVVRSARDPPGMSARFIGADRDQVFLMPPSLRDWVPEGHVVWTVLDAVAELDLAAFYAAYRVDGHGRPAYEPSLMVGLLLYAYARGNRSSRGIERSCVEDVAYRVVAGNLVPDHSTIAEFRCRHERALGEVFSGVLGLCARAGLASVGVVAIDGTKVSANASVNANRDFGQIAREILEEAAETDRREDALFGRERGDELPEHLRTREGRRKALREAKERLERERGQAVGRPRTTKTMRWRSRWIRGSS